MKINLIINLPIFFNFLIFKNKNIYKIIIYNNNFILNILNINTYNIKFFYINKNNNSIILYKNKNNFYLKNEIQKNLILFNLYLFIKIKFKGKGYKIKINKKIKNINFYFNYSHITSVILKKIILKLISKNKFIILCKNYNSLKNISKIITNIKPINFYTLRGLRNSKQIIVKRKGKKNSTI